MNTSAGWHFCLGLGWGGPRAQLRALLLRETLVLFAWASRRRCLGWEITFIGATKYESGCGSGQSALQGATFFLTLLHLVTNRSPCFFGRDMRFKFKVLGMGSDDWQSRSPTAQQFDQEVVTWVWTGASHFPKCTAKVQLRLSLVDELAQSG